MPNTHKLIIKEYGHIPTKKEIFQKIRESQDRMMTALQGAFNHMPEDPKLRQQFIDALEHAAKFNRGVKQITDPGR